MRARTAGLDPDCCPRLDAGRASPRLCVKSEIGGHPLRRALGRLGRAAGWALLLLLVLVIRASPIWPAPELPAGQRLELLTEPPHLLPHIGCPTAALGPVRFRTTELEAVFVRDGRGPIPVRWPTGWAAWRIDGTAYLFSHEGKVVARDGDVLDGFGGGSYRDDPGSEVETFHVCLIFR